MNNSPPLTASRHIALHVINIEHDFPQISDQVIHIHILTAEAQVQHEGQCATMLFCTQ